MTFKTPIDDSGHRRRRAAVWIGAALAGLVVAAGLTTAAAQLSNQSVGLSSEPVSAGDELAPAVSPTPTPTRTAKPQPTRTPAPRPARTSTPAPTPRATTTAVPTVDDNGGHGGDDSGGDDSRGRGRGGDD